MWMPVKHAAAAAGVPERSAYRWAKRGVIAVQKSGKVQLVEVGALRAYAARPVNATAAKLTATHPGDRIAEVAAIADWDERLCAVETGLVELFDRVTTLATGLGA